MKKISTTSTKNDILEAYEEVLSYLNDQKQENSTLKKEIADRAKTVFTAKEFVASSDFSITLDQFGVAFVKQIEDIKIKFAQDKQSFENIQQAIVVEKTNLDDLYKIKAQAESLEALIFTNKQAKEKLDLELKLLKDKTETEIDMAQASWTELLSKSKIEKQREDEEFLYKQKIARRNDDDIYMQYKAKLEQELNDRKELFEKEILTREIELKTKEDEVVELRQMQKNYQQNLINVANKTEKDVSEKLKTEYEFKQKLDNKELEVQLKLYQQEIELLKSKSAEQQIIINELNEKSNKASDQVKDIALKAIEGASQSRWNNNEKRDDNNRKTE